MRDSKKSKRYSAPTWAISYPISANRLIVLINSARLIASVNAC